MTDKNTNNYSVSSVEDTVNSGIPPKPGVSASPMQVEEDTMAGPEEHNTKNQGAVEGGTVPPGTNPADHIEGGVSARDPSTEFTKKNFQNFPKPVPLPDLPSPAETTDAIVKKMNARRRIAKKNRKSKQHRYPVKTSPDQIKAMKDVFTAIERKRIPVTPQDYLSVKLASPKWAKLRKAFELTLKYEGDIKRALKESGYKESSIQEPAKITRSQGWNELIDYYFPTRELMEKDKELLNHPDWRANNAALDRIHKIRGSFVKRVDINITHSEEMRQLSDEDLVKLKDEGNEIIDAEVIDIEPLGSVESIPETNEPNT